jgi:CRP/FNR family transcriptional regulator, anaerobic regulatory protein
MFKPSNGWRRAGRRAKGAIMSLVLASYETPRRAAFAGAAKTNPCINCAARRLSICAVVEPKDLGRLAAATSQQRLQPGETFLNEGDDASHFFNITSGAAKVYKLLPNGRRQITGFLFAGDLLGLAFNDTYTYSAETLSDVTLCRFPRRQFEGLLEEMPRMERRLLSMASNELAAAQEQMVLLGRKTARERVASFLLGMVHRTERAGRPSDVVVLPMTRADIADYLGLTTETVSRTFTSLRTDGVIALDGANRVRILDLEGIEELAETME